MAKSISKKLEEILKTGTPKQKAVLVCRDFTDRNTNEQKPLLTEDEVKAIKDSLSDNEAKEYNKWISVYNTYASVATLFGLAFAEYRANATTLLCCIRQWEDYTNEENHLNALLDELKAKGNEEAVKSFYETIKLIDLPLADILIDKEGYVNIDVGTPEDYKGGIYEQILHYRKLCYGSLVSLKALTQVIESWTDRMRSKALMPPIMVSSIEQAKEDYALSVAPAYSSALLKKREERGEKVTKQERYRAIFPNYDDTEVPEEVSEYFEQRFKEIYRNAKR